MPDPKNNLTGLYEGLPQFHDCDPMGVVWHGHYFKFLEAARCDLLRRYDYDYPQMKESGWLWPVVDARAKYVRPLLYAQPFVIESKIVEWESRLRLDYRIMDKATGEKITTAYTIQVAVDAKTQQMQFVCPKVLWEKLGVEPQS